MMMTGNRDEVMTDDRRLLRPAALTAALLLAATLGGQPIGAQTAADRAGAERAAQDYLGGLYEGDSDRIRRSVSPDMVKVGYYRENGRYQRSPMTFDELVQFADDVRARGRYPAADAPRRVEVLDVLDQTAVVKVYAWWGSDYLSMARIDGRWQILQILWQSPPEG